MKVTSELKEIIRKKLYREADRKFETEQEKLADIMDELNDNLLQSPEYGALMNAKLVFEAKVEEAIKDQPGLYMVDYYRVHKADKKGNHRSPIMLGFNNTYRMEAESILNQILVKLSYGKNFEDITATLAEFGISL